MQQRVSLITLGVADVAAARAFYERLGWRVGLDAEETEQPDAQTLPAASATVAT